jgi:hypothetical protein
MPHLTNKNWPHPTITHAWQTLLLSALILLGALNAHAQNFADISVQISHDDNASRGFISSDTHADESASLSFTVGRFIQLSSDDSLSLFTSVDATAFDRLSGLDAQSLTIGATHQHKFGLGAYVPVLSTTLSWQLEDSNQKTRDRQISSLQVQLRKRLTPAWLIQFGAVKEFSEGLHDGQRYQSKYSARNDIYDFDQASIFTSLEYSFSDFSTLTLGYSLQDGYTVSSALAPNLALLSISKALTLDPAVEPPIGRHQVAYTLKTRAHIFDINWSIPVGRDSALAFSVSRQLIVARQNVDYSNDQLAIAFMHAF